jgi:hypothetical protein
MSRPDPEWWAWEIAVVMAGWLCTGDAAAAGAAVEGYDSADSSLSAAAGAVLDDDTECTPLSAQPVLGNTMVLGAETYCPSPAHPLSLVCWASSMAVGALLPLRRRLHVPLWIRDSRVHAL